MGKELHSVTDSNRYENSPGFCFYRKYLLDCFSFSIQRCLSAVHAALSSKLTRLELVFDDRKFNLSFILHCRYSEFVLNECLMFCSQ